MKRLSIQAAINTFTGFGQIACETVAGLTGRGWGIEVKPLSIQETAFAPVPLEIKDLLTPSPSAEWELTIAELDRPQIRTHGKRSIYWTMWEHDHLSPIQTKVLNASEAVIVPTEWMKRVFAKTVKQPIYVVPLGINPTIFLPSPVPRGGPCVLGAAGSVATKRRQFETVLEAFRSVFSNVKGAELRLKLMPGETMDVDTKVVKVTSDFLPWFEFSRWYQGLTAFVSVANEGCGLLEHQAMASGRPVLTTAAGRARGIATRENSYPVAYTRSWCNFGNRQLGTFVQPDLVSLACQMRRVQLDREEASEKGALAAVAAQKLTWENTMDMLEITLNEIVQA